MAVLGLPFLWLAVFFLAPFAIVLKISLSDPQTAQPPYRPLLPWNPSWSDVQEFIAGLDFENFETLLGDDLYAQAALSSLRIAAISTAMLLGLGYPIAYAMARAPRNCRPLLIGLVILPFWTSFLIRVYAWIAILKPEGLLNQALLTLGVVAAPVSILNTESAVLIGIVYAYLPFMILPVYASLERLDRTLIEAAQDLGSPPWKAFWTVTVPMSLPGIVAGSLLCFIPIVGRVRHPRPARRVGDPDDRPHAVERVLLQPRLAPGRGRSGRPAPDPGGSDRALPRGGSAPMGDARVTPRLSGFNADQPRTRLRFLYLPILILIGQSFNARNWSRSGAVLDPVVREPVPQRSAAGCGVGDDPDRVPLCDLGDRARDARRGRLGAPRAFPGSRAVHRHDLRAARDAGGDHRAVAAAAVRGDRPRSRILDRDAGAHDVHDVLCRRDRAVAPRHLRSFA
jgi:putrescine transport system permease protein